MRNVDNGGGGTDKIPTPDLKPTEIECVKFTRHFDEDIAKWGWMESYPSNGYYQDIFHPHLHVATVVRAVEAALYAATDDEVVEIVIRRLIKR